MGVLRKIFGNDKERGKVLDGAISGLDKIWYTDEEKADAKRKTQEWYLSWLSATNPQNLARRWIAVIVTALWSICVLIAIAGFAFGLSFAEHAYKILNDVVNAPFMTIIAFYFTAHLVRTWRNPVQNSLNPQLGKGGDNRRKNSNA